MTFLTPSEIVNPTEFKSLPFSEQFILWATRTWVRSNQGASSLHQILRTGFRAAKIEAGYLILHAIMTTLTTTARKDILFHCNCCDGITLDEHKFLGIIAHFQTGDEATAQMILSDWLPIGSANVVGAMFGELASLLKANNLNIRERQGLPIGDNDPKYMGSPPPNMH